MKRLASAARIARNALILLVVVSGLLLAAIGIDSCSGNEERQACEEAQAALANELQAYKDGDPSRMEGEDFSDLEALGINPSELKSELTDGFAYEFKDAAYYPKSDAVILDVTIQSRQMVEAVRKILPVAYSTMFESAYNGATEEELQETFVKQVMDQVKKEELTTTDVSVEMLLQDGRWVVSPSGERQLQRAIMGNLNALYDDIEAINTAPKVDKEAIEREVALSS